MDRRKKKWEGGEAELGDTTVVFDLMENIKESPLRDLYII